MYISLISNHTHSIYMCIYKWIIEPPKWFSIIQQARNCLRSVRCCGAVQSSTGSLEGHGYYNLIKLFMRALRVCRKAISAFERLTRRMKYSTRIPPGTHFIRISYRVVIVVVPLSITANRVAFVKQSVVDYCPSFVVRNRSGR